MGRSAQPSPDGSNPRQRGIDAVSLDDDFASILIDIEQEQIPQRLLHLASVLQKALNSRPERDRPN